jgi:hypothetical protein
LSQESNLEEANTSGEINIWKVLSDNAILIPVALFTFVVTHVLLSTRGNIPIALGVIAAVGVPTVVVNTIVSSIGLIVTLVLLGTAGSLFRVVRWFKVTSERPSRQQWGLVIALWVGVVLLAPVALLVLATLSLGGLLLIPVEDRKKLISVSHLPRSNRVLVYTARITFSIFLFVFTLLVLIQPWLPMESIEVKQQDPIKGYVLSEQGGWFSVLTEDSDSLLRIKNDAILSRRVCSNTPLITSWSDKPLPQLLRSGRAVERDCQ